MKKLFLLGLAIFSVISTNAQDFILLKEINGVEIKHKTSKLRSDNKNSHYITEITYKNITPNDIFYAEIPSESKYITPLNVFGTIVIQNVTSWMSDKSFELKGSKTNLSSSGNVIYVMPAGKEFTNSIQYKVKNENEPLVTSKSSSKIQFVSNITDFM